jgi:hypothetical protein
MGTKLLERDPSGLDAHTPGAKLDSGKLLAWTMVSGFARALRELAKVTTVGARKYTKNGWKQVDDGPARYREAMMRHTLDLASGEAVDKDTQCHHLAQIAWNALAALELELSGAAKLTAESSTSNPALRSYYAYVARTAGQEAA